MKKLVTAFALAASAATAAHAETYQVPMDISAGHLNIRNGPGVNFALIGSIPAGTKISWQGKATCVSRQDGIRGADWCKVNVENGKLAPSGGYSPNFGWVSKAGLMPVADPDPAPQAQAPMPDGIGLVCGKPVVTYERGGNGYDPNPVIKTEVSYNPAEHAWRVFHQFAQGGVVSRSEQYAMTDMSDGHLVQWKGTYLHSRNKTMIGEVREDKQTHEPYYLEWIYDGAKLEMNSLVKCNYADDGDIPDLPARPEIPLPSQPNGDGRL